MRITRILATRVVCATGVTATLLVVVFCLHGQSGDAGATARGATGAASKEPPCVAPAKWFPPCQTPKPDPKQSFHSFCDFHKWAWQSFLWLTQEDPKNGLLRFETFPTNHDVITGKLPSKDRPLKLIPRTGKSDRPGALSEINQAGEAGVLVDHNRRVVYYSQHVNTQMFKDIVGKKWNDPTVLNEIPPGKKFEIGDVELKITWKIVEPGEGTSTFFVRDALVDKLVNRYGKIKVDTSTQFRVKVALVGMHIAGWVKGHREAIWATFEHVNNAPDYAPNQDQNEPVSDRDWTFYTANTKALECNQMNSVPLKLDERTQELSPVTQVARVYPFGMVAGTSNADANLAAIKSLNKSVHQQLAKDNVWRNYFEVGAVWGKGTKSLKPNETLQDQLIGSTLLSNSTIETFTQNIKFQENCFSCHNTLMYNPKQPNIIRPLQGTNINLSHIILEAYIKNQK